ncbi:hypothetical protein K501DRAFT_276990 [Backusella circina FSU 941]|nr:hypothetical protein K501DRAFT_276990 [Backusella circina FSU 941]
MKLFYVIALVSALAVSVKAECECDVDDVVCLQTCVQKGNTCISQCEDSDCFASCVDDHWPGPDLNYPHSEMIPTRSETPSSATMTNGPQVATASTASSGESSAMPSNWSPSSTWSSVPTWTNSVPPSFSGSLRPSASGSGPVSSNTSDGQKMTTNGIVSILGLGLALYLN